MSRCKNCGKIIFDYEKRAMCPHCGTGIARPNEILDEYNRPDDYECTLHPSNESCTKYESRSSKKGGERKNVAPKQHSGRKERQNPKNDVYETKSEKPKGGDVLLSLVAYLGGLVLFPIMSLSSASNYVRFHTNQGALLFLFTIALFALQTFFENSLPYYYYGVLFDAWRYINMIPFLLGFFGIINAISGKMKRLPIIGGFNLIKPKK